MMMDKVTVIIPAYNEGLGIAKTLRELLAYCPDVNVIVVDDGSKDNTFEEACKFGSKVRIVRHSKNRGYGAALKTGMRMAKTRVIAWYDSDGQHRPEDLVKVCTPVVESKADAVLGMRDKKSAFVAKRVPGKFILRMISQLIVGQKIPDLNCGLRAFNSRVIKSYLHLLPNGFSASATSTLLMIKRGFLTEFVNIHTEDRIGTSTVRFRDGFRTLKLLFRILILFDAFTLFFIFALLQIVPGLVYSLIEALRSGLGVPVLGAMVIISGIITFGMGIISSQIHEMRQERFEFFDNNTEA